jgi:Uri superfamily endonuclease
MNSCPGSYVLIFHCPTTKVVSVGSLGELTLKPGYYAYVGSAFGPGGVAARIRHHRQHSQRPHWHLDYLRPSLQLLEIWFSHDSQRREHQWAGELASLRGARQPFPGFGASDCGCSTHWLRFGFKPSFNGFRRRMRRCAPRHGRFYREVVEEG